MIASALAHIGVYLVLRWSSTMPHVDFELTLPSEVEFGLTEQTAVTAPAPPPPPPEPVAAAPAIAPGDEPKPKPKPKPEPTDAGVPDASELPEEVARPAETRPDGGAPGGDAHAPMLAALAPKGAQIALRVHMGRVRESQLADDVRALLDAVPDWRLVLGGSGIDPLRDLERLYLATPDLRRSNLVIAGEYVGSAELPRQAVASLAAARGQDAHWSKRAGIAVAPWLNEDETARVVALIAPHQFAITRPDDLPRVLLVARALAARRREAEKHPAAETEGDALLALGERDSFALSVEGARMFARGNTRGVPERLELAVSLTDEGEYLVQSTGYFEDAQAAERAQEYWTNVRDQFAGHPLVALIGMRAPLTRSELHTSDNRVLFTTHVTVPQARVLLGFVRQALDRGAGGAPSPPRSTGEVPSSPPRSAGEVSPRTLPSRLPEPKLVSPPGP